MKVFFKIHIIVLDKKKYQQPANAFVHLNGRGRDHEHAEWRCTGVCCSAFRWAPLHRHTQSSALSPFPTFGNGRESWEWETFWCDRSGGAWWYKCCGRTRWHLGSYNGALSVCVRVTSAYRASAFDIPDVGIEFVGFRKRGCAFSSSSSHLGLPYTLVTNEINAI